MAEDLIQEGMAPFSVPSLDTPCYTYYKIYGNLECGTPPLIALHGGPGVGHEYMVPFTKLWPLYGIPVVVYDQIGCAKSTHLREKAGDHAFWKVDMFADELENLLKHLRISRADGPGFYVLGHSWGGTLSARFASRQPPGLRRLVLASASSDGPIFCKSLGKLKKQISLESQRAIDEAVEKVDFTSQAYLDAMTEFSKMFLCRADPWPPAELVCSFKNQAEDATVRHTVQGPSPWLYNGVLSTWSSIPFASQINVPTLIYNGEFDTNQDGPTAPWFHNIPKVRWITFAGASHMPHLDSPEMQQKTMKVVGEFLLAHGEVSKSGG